MRNVRAWAIGGVIGPVAFMATSWLAGLTSDHYSVVQNAISELAASWAPTQPAMTAAFVVYGAGMVAYSFALRIALRGWAWLSALVAGVATLGLAAAPMGSATSNTVHSWFAIAVGSAAAVTPLLASRQFGFDGHDAWARASLYAGMVCFICFIATLPGPGRGLIQRLGLGAVHIWIIASAIAMIRFGRLDAPVTTEGQRPTTSRAGHS